MGHPSRDFADTEEWERLEKEAKRIKLALATAEPPLEVEDSSEANMETLTQEEAIASGYYPMTDPFRAGEEHLLEAAIKQLGSIKAVLVPVSKGTEIWRINGELRFSREEKATC